ncbi:MAG TPA: mechanosensitive ion channel domain-containing protein [Candidatus Acidoferrum sp.]|nr:mechanosensitive ion channel domain-containing protein [Candidatus Acidoferrum sp.]
MVLRRFLFLAPLVGLLAAAALAQIPGITPAAPASGVAPQSAADPLGRETPRGTVMGFLRAAQDENYPVAVQYFQPASARRRIRADEEQDLAAQLLTVINQKILASSLDSLSRDAQGRLDDGLPPNQELLTGVREGSGSFSIQLIRVDDDRGGKIWLIARKSLDTIPEVFDSLQFFELEKKLPATLTRNRVLYMPLWQWLAILLAVPVAIAIGWALSLIPRLLLRYYRKRNAATALPPIRLLYIGPGTLLLSAFVHYMLVFMIGASIVYRQYYRRVLWVFLALAAYWLITRITRDVSARIISRLTASGRMGERSVVSLARRVLEVLAFIIIGLIALSSLGINVTAALAGLGIGGLAIGLGAQKTFENLIGGISILTDKALQVGDACRIGDQRGTVEDIGLRSTKLRTEERTVVTIPNGTVANAVLENFRQRDKILFRQTVHLRYDLAPDHVRYALQELRATLKQNNRVEDASSRVRLLRFIDAGMDVEIYAYLLVRDYADFLALQEDLLLGIADTLERTGALLAFPASTTILAKEVAVDPEKEKAAKAAIENARKAAGGRMPPS